MKQSFHWAHHGARQKKNRRDLETIAVVVVVIMELNFMRSIFSSLILLAKPKIPPIQLTNFHWWSEGSMQWIKSTKFKLNSDTNDGGKKIASQSNSNMGDWKQAQSFIAFAFAQATHQIQTVFSKLGVYRVITYESHHDLPVRLNMIFGLQNRYVAN